MAWFSKGLGYHDSTQLPPLLTARLRLLPLDQDERLNVPEVSLADLACRVVYGQPALVLGGQRCQRPNHIPKPSRTLDFRSFRLANVSYAMHG